MRYDMVKFERGQVWMIRFKHPEAAGREQEKDRPWLVLSVGKFNASSGMITCVPMTSRDETRTPAQVFITNTYGKPNVIMCEQIRSFDYKSGNYIFDFLGNVSDDILEKVDVATSIHLGMHYSPITLNKLYDSMEAIIKSVGHMQQKADTPKFTDDDVLKFAEKLMMLASNPANHETSATAESDTPKYGYTEVRTLGVIKNPKDLGYEETPELYDQLCVNDKPIETLFKSPDICEKDSNSEVDEFLEYPHPSKKKRIKWTRETCEKFLSDAENLPMKQVMELWNISKKPRFYSMKNYVEGLLKKMK